MHSELCYHKRTERIDDQFVKCYDCGHSFVKLKKEIVNKSCLDFTNENLSFDRNYYRNFTNIIEEPIEYGPPPIEYYADKNLQNKIIVNRKIVFSADPPKYQVMVNSEPCIMTDDQIKRLLKDTKAIKMKMDLDK